MTFENATRIPEDCYLTGLNFSSSGKIMLNDLKVEDFNSSDPIIPLQGLELQVPEKGLRFTMRTMIPYASVTMAMNNGSEKPPVYTFSSTAQKYNKVEAEGNVQQVLHDNFLSVHGPGAEYPIYTRPILEEFYMDHQIAALRADWENQGEDVADHTFEFQIIGNQLWIDGSFYCNIPGDERVKSIKIGAAYPFTEIKTLPDIKEYEDGLAVNVPLPVAFKDYFPTALCQENLGSYLLECDGYLSRSPFGGMRDCYLRAVPTAQYNKAIVTYSMDSDTEKSTDLTLRLTRFKNGGGRSPAAMAISTVTLPRIKEGKVKTVELDIPIGNIQDIVFMENKASMDVEVLGGLYEKNQ